MNPKVKKLTTLGMLAAIAYVVMLVGRFPLVLFLSYDPKDVVIVIAGFLYGPMSSFLISAAVSPGGDVHRIRYGADRLRDEHPLHLLVCLHRRLPLQKAPFAQGGGGRPDRRGCRHGGGHAAVELPDHPRCTWRPRARWWPSCCCPPFSPSTSSRAGSTPPSPCCSTKPVVGALRRSRLLPPAPEGQAGHIKPGVMLVAAGGADHLRAAGAGAGGGDLTRRRLRRPPRCDTMLPSTKEGATT